PRNSLRSLRELRSDNRGESDKRSALRARAGTAALLGCAQARRRRAAHAFADTVAALEANVPAFTPNTSAVSRAAGGNGPGHRRAARRGAGRGEARGGDARPAAVARGGPVRCLRRRAAQPRG